MWLHQVLIVAHGIFLAARGILKGCMQILSCGLWDPVL